MNLANKQDEPIPDAIGDLSSLCRIAGIAAFLLLAYSLATIVQMIALGGPPATATDAFALLQHNKTLGLLRLDLPTMIVMPLYYLLFLGLFAALRRIDLAKVLLSTVLVFAGVTLLLSSPAALSVATLSERYAAATSDAARAQFLAAGEALMASDIWHGTGAILGGVLMQAGAILICCVMLRGGVFSRTTAWLGIVMHSLDLAHIVCGLVVPVAGVLLMATAGPLYPVWFFLLGRRLLRLAEKSN